MDNTHWNRISLLAEKRIRGCINKNGEHLIYIFFDNLVADSMSEEVKTALHDTLKEVYTQPRYARNSRVGAAQKNN